MINKNKIIKALLLIFMINLISIFPITKISVNDNVIDKDNNENSENLFQPIYSGLDVNKFDHYKIITINHNKVEGNTMHTNFSVLISLLDKDLHDKTQQPDGDDIAFSNGTIWLDHEIELFDKNYNETHAKLVAWVRIPALSTSTDTIIYMYYGNSTMESQQNPSGVWSSDYSGVWHLNETDGGPNAIKDSTNNENHGTDASNPELGIDGKIGGATDFDGYNTDQEITIAASESLNPTYITVSAWIYPRGQTEPFGDPETGMFVSDYDWTSSSTKVYNLYMHRTNRVHALVYWTEEIPGQPNVTQVYSDVIPLFEWHFVQLTVNSTTVALYVDGALSGVGSTFSHTGGLVQYDNVVEIGSEEQMSSTDHEFNGTVDEVRISNGARSAGWIATEYNNQHDPNSFYSIGEEDIITLRILSPFSNQLNGLSTPEYNLLVPNPNLDSIWYTLDGGETNSTPVSASGTIDPTMWAAKGNGTVTIRFYANDTMGKMDYEDVTILKDAILPFADITDPYPDGDKIGDTVISISGTANGTGSNIVSMYINDTRWGADQKPQTDPSGSVIGTFTFNNNTYIPPGSYWIKINITDAAGNVNISIRFFEVEFQSALLPSDDGGGGGGGDSNSDGDFIIPPIILFIVIGAVGALIGVIIFIKKKGKKAPREKALGTIESIVD